MNNYLIVPMYTEDEINQKGYVHYKSWQEAYRGLISDEFLEIFTLDKCINTAHRWLDNILVAKDGEKVVGFVGYGPCREENITDTGEIYSIYVLEAYHGRKIGLSLMKVAMDKLSEYRKIVLWVLRGNEKAIGFYERYGFQLDGTTKEIILGTPQIELQMVLQRY